MHAAFVRFGEMLYPDETNNRGLVRWDLFLHELRVHNLQA